jgi:hypothetical protein
MPAGATRPSAESAVGSTPDAVARRAAHPTSAAQPQQRHSAPAVLSPASLALAVCGVLAEHAAVPTPPLLPTCLQMPKCCSPEGPRGPAPSPISPCMPSLAAVPYANGIPGNRMPHPMNSTSDARVQSLDPERSETPSTDIDDGAAEHSSALPAHWQVGVVLQSAATASPQHNEPAPLPDTTPLGSAQPGEVQESTDDGQGATDKEEQPAWDVYKVPTQATPQILRDPGPPRYSPLAELRMKFFMQSLHSDVSAVFPLCINRWSTLCTARVSILNAALACSHAARLLPHGAPTSC